MGCTVSQSRIGNISLAQTPRDRNSLFSAPTSQSERNKIHQRRGSFDAHDEQMQEQPKVLRRHSATIEKKKTSSNMDFLLKQSLSKAAMNDFSFKNSIESSQSSRRPSYNNLPDETPKKYPEEGNNYIFGRDSFGVKHHPLSPKIVNRHALLHEKRSSRQNSSALLINPFTGLSQFGSPHESVIHKDSNVQSEYQSPKLNSSIEMKHNQEHIEPHFAEPKVSTLELLFPKKHKNSGSIFFNEQTEKSQTGQISPQSNSHSHNRPQPASKNRFSNLSITSTELITYEAKPVGVQSERFKQRSSISTMDSLLPKSIPAVGSRTLESQGSLELNSSNAIKSSQFWKCETQSSIQELLPPIKKQEIPKSTDLTSNNRRRNKSFASLRANSLPQQNSSVGSKDLTEASTSQHNLMNFSKLSVSDKFKLNLLEVVRNEETSGHSVSSHQNDTISKLMRPLMARPSRGDRKESIKMEPIAELDSPNGKSVSTKQDKSEVLKENLLQLKRNSSRKSFNEKKEAESSSQNVNETNFKIKSRMNLFELIKDDAQEQSSRLRRPSIEISISKFEPAGSQDQLPSLNGFGPSPINQNENELVSRPTFPDLNNSKIMNNQSPTQNYHRQSMLNETNNRTLYNIEENVSPGNISRYDFTCENLEVEYDEARGTTRSQFASPGLQVLTGINSPAKHYQRPQAPEDIARQEPIYRNSTNLLKLCVLRRDYNNNVIGQLSRKDSLTSLSSIHGGGNADSIQESRFMDQLSNAGDFNSESPCSKKHAVIKMVDPQNHKPFKLSIFQQESDPHNETLPSQGEEQRQESAKTTATPGTRQSQKCIYKSKSVALPPLHIQEADSGVEQSVLARAGVEEKQKLNGGENSHGEKQLLAPSGRSEPTVTGNAKKRGYYRLSSEYRESSRSPNLKGAVLKRIQSTVIETNRLDKTRDGEGQKKINQYLFIKDLGKGGFGKVKLAQNTETKQYFAVKVANKAKLKRKLFSRTSDTANPLEREVAIMKKLEHPNIVRLWEVIDDPKEDKLYLVMDLIKKGAVMSKGYWKYENKEALDKSGISVASNLDTSMHSDLFSGKRVLSEEKALKYFRELILGLDYLHNHAKIIHRDIKPENLLIDEFDTLKISDFGVSMLMEDDSDELKNSAGTKLFLPPESFKGKSFRGKPADVWAAGATLFYFLTGKPPFMANNTSDLMQKVFHEELEYPEAMDKKIQDIIKGCLKKDPEERMTIQEIMTSAWLTEDGAFTVKNIYEDDQEFLDPSELEVQSSLTKLTFRARVVLAARLKMHLNKTRDKLSALEGQARRKSQDAKDQTTPSISNPLNLVNQNETQSNQRLHGSMRVNLLEAVKEDD